MKKISNKNKKIFIKCLGILVQPVTLGLPFTGAQLIAQGSIYALADKLISGENPIPDIDTILADTKKNIKQDVALILDQFDDNKELFKDLNFDTVKIAYRITNQWCNEHRGQYSDADVHEIKTAILKYLNEVQKWKLNNTEFLQGVLSDYGDSIQDLVHRVELNEIKIKTIQERNTWSSHNENGEDDSSKVFTANEQYVKSFTEPLFLHKKIENTSVNLASLFVYQKYSLLYDGLKTELLNGPQKDLVKCIDEFLHHNRKRFMIISGDAGSGKTSLMAWMNYHYVLHDLLAKKLFGDRPIITIRLRDIDRNDLSDSRDLVKAILGYMKIKSLSELEELYPDAIMILDGFDELCMIEAFNTNHDLMLIELMRRIKGGFQFIVTTRPKFINKGFDAPSTHIHLEHFDSELRLKWLKKYTKAIGGTENIDKKVVKYILDDEETRTCICDTPMTLYMLMAKKGVSDFLDNNWALYHHIFFEELSETEYNEMFPDDMRNYSHPVIDIREILYQISEEISYLMYKSGNSKFCLSQDEISGILCKLSKSITFLENANIRAIAENCFGICCYWKSNVDRGAVEFLHNDIRDFFLAEKIYRELNVLIEGVKAKGLAKDQLVSNIAEKLCHLVPYGVLETRVTEFIYFRALNNMERGVADFASFVWKDDLIGAILEKMNQNEIARSGVIEEQSCIDIIQRMINIIASTIQIHRYSFEPYLEGENVINWGLTRFPAGNNDRLNAWKNLFKAIFSQVPVTISFDSCISMASYGDFSNINLQYCDLRNIGFEHSRIHDSNLCDTVLSGSDFSSASLDNTKFINADLHYCSLRGAIIKGCNFTNADLRGTTLPDGSVSMDQEEQVEHLKSMGLSGLVI